MFGINDNNPQPTGGSDPQTPGGAAEPANPFSEDDGPVPELTAPSAPALTQPEPPAPGPSAGPAPASSSDDLLDLKQQALQNLQPLVSHLEQSPEEKFKTTMMLIQATDNSALVKQAYEAANQISDEKARAQALLDVVNEINYFTHHAADGEPKT